LLFDRSFFQILELTDRLFVNLTDYEYCPANTSYMREETNVDATALLGLSATYVRCDRGISNYCSFKM